VTPKARPEGCCAPPLARDPLPAKERRRLVAVFKALGDPTRLEIFRLVSAQPLPVCVCDVVARFDLRQPTISHHLRVLREAGLVTAERRGVWTYFAPSAIGIDLLHGAAGVVAPSDCCAKTCCGKT
jgi:ArsR family transcriptional regulator